MRKVFVEPVVLPEPRFRDGLGVRYVRTDGTDDPVEVLRPLWDVGKMQNAIRQRVSRLQSFRQARFITLRAAEVPRDDPSTIEVISDFVAGYRLSQYLEAARAGVITIDTSAAVYILRELRDSNPIRFGLTKAQVAQLKAAKQWDSFRYKWNIKREQYLRRNRLVCIVCGGISRSGITILERKICRNCCEEIWAKVK